jgi:hypothetical protein
VRAAIESGAVIAAVMYLIANVNLTNSHSVVLNSWWYGGVSFELNRERKRIKRRVILMACECPRLGEDYKQRARPVQPLMAFYLLAAALLDATLAPLALIGFEEQAVGMASCRFRAA